MPSDRRRPPCTHRAGGILRTAPPTSTASDPTRSPSTPTSPPTSSAGPTRCGSSWSSRSSTAGTTAAGASSGRSPSGTARSPTCAPGSQTGVDDPALVRLRLACSAPRRTPTHPAAGWFRTQYTRAFEDLTLALVRDVVARPGVPWRLAPARRRAALALYEGLQLQSLLRDDVDRSAASTAPSPGCASAGQRHASTPDPGRASTSGPGPCAASGHDSPRVQCRVVTFRRLAVPQATVCDRSAGSHRGVLTARRRGRPDGTPDGREARGGGDSRLPARGVVATHRTGCVTWSRFVVRGRRGRRSVTARRAGHGGS